MTITPEIRRDILAEHSKNPQRFSPFRTSKALGVPIQDVIKVIETNTDANSQLTVKHDGYGDPKVREFVVARRRAMLAGWDNNDPAIATARADYEAGTHLMVTGRDGPWLLLYSIPRKLGPKPRPDYFSTESFA